MEILNTLSSYELAFFGIGLSMVFFGFLFVIVFYWKLKKSVKEYWDFREKGTYGDPKDWQVLCIKKYHTVGMYLDRSFSCFLVNIGGCLTLLLLAVKIFW